MLVLTLREKHSPRLQLTLCLRDSSWTMLCRTDDGRSCKWILPKAEPTTPLSALLPGAEATNLGSRHALTCWDAALWDLLVM
jgi:hypothetical protein